MTKVSYNMDVSDETQQNFIYNASLLPQLAVL